MSTGNEEVSGLGLRLSKGEDKISSQHDSLAAVFPGSVVDISSRSTKGP